jgi:hypothetical protein
MRFKNNTRGWMLLQGNDSALASDQTFEASGNVDDSRRGVRYDSRGIGFVSALDEAKG